MHKFTPMHCIYLDETYELSKKHAGRGFYVFAGVSILESELLQHRDFIRGIVGTNYWHTTEIAKTAAGRAEVRDFLEAVSSRYEFEIWLAESLEGSDRSGERVRSQLMKQLVSTSVQSRPEGASFVFERRRDSFQQNADLRVISELRSRQIISRQTSISFVSPAEENLLWVADLVAWAFRQHYLNSDSTFLAPIAKQLKIFGL